MMRRLSGCALLLAALCARQATAAMLSDLRCENATNPLGVDTPHPRLSWTFAGGGGVQRAYQILVASSGEKLNAGEADLWDSGRVMSSLTTQIPYEGKALPSRQRCYWKVRAWDGFYQPTVYSGAATWEMGLLSAGDWKAKWIGSAPAWGGGGRYFRYAFGVRKPVKAARVYIAGVGYYELHIDGKVVGERITETAGEKIPYATYDVRDLIARGENVLGVIAGSVLLQLDVDYEDGDRDEFYTDAGAVAGRVWIVSLGPILSNSVSDGEVYDARLEKSGWDSPDVSLPKAEEWVIAQAVEPPAGRLISQWMSPVRTAGTATRKMTEPKPGIFVFDIGRVANGLAELRVKGERGKAITLRFAENLAADGTVGRRNPAGVYILKGGGEEKWEPHSAARSLRYVQVEGFPGRPESANILVKNIN